MSDYDDMPVAAEIDWGHSETDKAIERMEKKIAKEYRQAYKEMKKKVDEYLDLYDEKRESMLQKVKDGLMTQQEFNEWSIRYIATGERWKAMRDTLADDLANANNIARKIINSEMADVYSMNHNYAVFQAEKDAMIDTSYTLYSRESVEHLLQNKKSLLPAPKEGSYSWYASRQKDLRWNQQKINSSLIQGLLQGESIPKITERLMKIVGDNRTCAVRCARTMTTSVENKGRNDAYTDLKKKGVELDQIWVSTLDGRTRHSHRLVYGEKRNEKTGKFSNGCRYPADPQGRPEEVYNCRCTMIGAVKGFPVDLPKYSRKMGNMDFDEWQGMHKSKENQMSAWDYIKKNDVSRNDLATILPYSQATKLEGELRKYSSREGVGIGKYFAGLKDGTYQNKEFIDFLNSMLSPEAFVDPNASVILERARLSGIDSLPLMKLKAPKSFADFVSDVAGGDMTKGSCASLSLCYTANVAGYDVRDFRGGKSQDFFADYPLWRRISEMKDVISKHTMTKTPLKVAMSYLADMDIDKDNILLVGSHAAVVRKDASGKMYYLEQQSPDTNGWSVLTENSLSWRFIAVKRSKYERDVILIDVDSLSRNENLPKIASYLNTLEDKQKKGSYGSRK